MWCSACSSSFRARSIYDQNVVSYLELMRVPYTGCNPRGLMLARGKDLSKTLVHYHRIPVPAFAVFPKHRKVKRPTRLALPLIVKSLSEDASWGISQASVVDTDEKLVERVNFIHEKIGTAAIAEQYIEGRELYVGVLGNDRLRVLPIWELEFRNLAQGAWPIATEKVKHDPDYQERRGILHGPAKDLAPEIRARIERLGEADFPHAGARRLCAHRFSLVRRRRSVFPRSQSQSRDRREPGIRRGREARRHRISRPAAKHRGIGHAKGTDGAYGLTRASAAPREDDEAAVGQRRISGERRNHGERLRTATATPLTPGRHSLHSKGCSAKFNLHPISPRSKS